MEKALLTKNEPEIMFSGITLVYGIMALLTAVNSMRIKRFPLEENSIKVEL